MPAGEQGIPVAFGTDAPHIRRWGRPLLYGPGSILDAHTSREGISLTELRASVDAYERLCTRLLEGNS